MTALLCWLGGYRLIEALKNDNKKFNQAKSLSTIGITLGILLWFVGFISIGGEWFLMWQSKLWNGQQSAFRITLILIYIIDFIFLIKLSCLEPSDQTIVNIQKISCNKSSSLYAIRLPIS